jgi:hypothetical protein
LLVDIETGKLEWVVNGYEARQSAASVQSDFAKLTNASNEELGAGPMAGFHFGEMKFPESKIGDAAARTELSEIKPAAQVEPLPAATAVRPPKIPLPPPIRPRMNVPFGRR